MFENSHFSIRAEAVERALEDWIAGLWDDLQKAASELMQWRAAAAALSLE